MPQRTIFGVGCQNLFIGRGHLQDVLDQLFLVVEGVLEAEEDAADDPDDDHHADDDERGRHNQ